MLLSLRPLSTPKIFLLVSLILSCFLFFHHFHTLPTLSYIKGSFTSPSKSIGIPKKLWYKVGPKGLSPESEEWMRACIEKNPTYRSEVLNDQTSDAYVQKNFAFRPDIVSTYNALPLPILKADLLRYLLLFVEGGIWLDTDVSCSNISIDSWIPEEFKNKTQLVVGWEFDVGWGENIERQFTTWTIMAAPKSPHLWKVIEDIMDGVRDIVAPHAMLDDNLVDKVVPLTGPQRFTRSVLASLASARNETAIDMASIDHLLTPKLVEDVLILPGFDFAALTNHYTPEQEVGPPFVEHHYSGSWKNQHGGESLE